MRLCAMSLVACVSLALLAPAAAAQTRQEKGQAAYYPWSGFWWQHKSGGLTGPLQKYDSVYQTHSSAWERDHHVPPGADIPPWFGHCHAWSASSVIEREPPAPRQVGNIVFGVGDQKGLLAACHGQDVSNSYGTRCESESPGPARDDLWPEQLLHALQLYIRQNQLPLILDLEAGPQVWNYPVYQYQVDYQIGSDGSCEGILQLCAADDNVVPDYLGTQYIVRRYTFQAQFSANAMVAGSSRWTGRSVQDHPDFAWYPYVAVAENPDVDGDKVAQVVGYQIADPRTPPRGEDNGPITPPDPSPNPGPNPNPGPSPEPPQPVPFDDALDPYMLAEMIAGKTSDFGLNVLVDKGNGGKYQPGETVKIVVFSQEPGYLYLFDIDSSGKPHLVFPLVGEPNAIGTQRYKLPVDGGNPFLTAEGPGQHDLKAIVVDRPLQITGFRRMPQQGQQQQQSQKPGPQSQKSVPGQIVRAGKGLKPEPIVLPPTSEEQVSNLILAGLRGGQSSGKGVPRPKGIRFAQSLSSYFVVGSAKR